MTAFRRFALALIALAFSTQLACAQYLAPDSATTRAGIVSSNTGTTGAVTATIPAVQGKFSMLCGFTIQSVGGTAQVAPTVTGLQGGTLNYTVLNSALVNTLTQTFTPCLQSTGVNTAIVVTSPAAAAATAVTVDAWGFNFSAY